MLLCGSGGLLREQARWQAAGSSLAARSTPDPPSAGRPPRRPVGPDDRQRVDLGRVPQTESRYRFDLREVAPRRHHLPPQRLPGDFDFDPAAGVSVGVAVSDCSLNRSQCAQLLIVAQQPRRAGRPRRSGGRGRRRRRCRRRRRRGRRSASGNPRRNASSVTGRNSVDCSGPQFQNKCGGCA